MLYYRLSLLHLVATQRWKVNPYCTPQNVIKTQNWKLQYIHKGHIGYKERIKYRQSKIKLKLKYKVK